MADPHVQRLLYRFKVTAPNTNYKNPPAVSYENDVFKATLEAERLLLEMKQHFATSEDAKAARCAQCWYSLTAPQCRRGS